MIFIERNDVMKKEYDDKEKDFVLGTNYFLLESVISFVENPSLFDG